MFGLLLDCDCSQLLSMQQVKFIHPTPVSVQSQCTVGTRPGYLGQLYGIRETTSVSNGRESTACIEFKCRFVNTLRCSLLSIAIVAKEQRNTVLITF